MAAIALHRAAAAHPGESDRRLGYIMEAEHLGWGGYTSSRWRKYWLAIAKSGEELLWRLGWFICDAYNRRREAGTPLLRGVYFAQLWRRTYVPPAVIAQRNASCDAKDNASSTQQPALLEVGDMGGHLEGWFWCPLLDAPVPPPPPGGPRPPPPSGGPVGLHVPHYLRKLGVTVDPNAFPDFPRN